MGLILKWHFLKRLSRWTRQSEIEKLKIYIGYMKCVDSQMKTELNGRMDGWMEWCQMEILSIVGGNFRVEIFKVENMEVEYASSWEPQNGSGWYNTFVDEERAGVILRRGILRVGSEDAYIYRGRLKSPRNISLLQKFLYLAKQHWK